MKSRGSAFLRLALHAGEQSPLSCAFLLSLYPRGPSRFVQDLKLDELNARGGCARDPHASILFFRVFYILLKMSWSTRKRRNGSKVYRIRDWTFSGFISTLYFSGSYWHVQFLCIQYLLVYILYRILSFYFSFTFSPVYENWYNLQYARAVESTCP